MNSTFSLPFHYNSYKSVSNYLYISFYLSLLGKKENNKSKTGLLEKVPCEPLGLAAQNPRVCEFAPQTAKCSIQNWKTTASQQNEALFVFNNRWVSKGCHSRRFIRENISMIYELMSYTEEPHFLGVLPWLGSGTCLGVTALLQRAPRYTSAPRTPLGNRDVPLELLF